MCTFARDIVVNVKAIISEHSDDVNQVYQCRWLCVCMREYVHACVHGCGCMCII